LAQCWFPRLAIPNAKNKYIFQIKYKEAILSNSTRKLLWFEITKMLIAVYKFIVSFVIIFGTLSLPMANLIQPLASWATRGTVPGRPYMFQPAFLAVWGETARRDGDIHL